MAKRSHKKSPKVFAAACQKLQHQKEEKARLREEASLIQMERLRRRQMVKKLQILEQEEKRDRQAIIAFHMANAGIGEKFLTVSVIKDLNTELMTVFG